MALFTNRIFIKSIIRDGRFTEARQRLENGTASPIQQRFEDQSCWSLVCEEVLDTDHDPEIYDAIYCELVRRGFTYEQIDTMRRLAWRTAGWLNYDCMLWEWVYLDEDHIRQAIELRYKHWFRKKQRVKDLQMVEDYLQQDTKTS